MDKIRLIVGNESIESQNINSKINDFHFNYNVCALDCVSLTDYLTRLSQFLSQPPKFIFNNFGINLICKNDENRNENCHCCNVTSQVCLVPINKGSKKINFQVALVNASFKSNKMNNPPILAIVATNGGASAQVIQGPVVLFCCYSRYSILLLLLLCVAWCHRVLFCFVLFFIVSFLGQPLILPTAIFGFSCSVFRSLIVSNTFAYLFFFLLLQMFSIFSFVFLFFWFFSNPKEMINRYFSMKMAKQVNLLQILLVQQILV